LDLLTWAHQKNHGKNAQGFPADSPDGGLTNEKIDNHFWQIQVAQNTDFMLFKE